MKGHDRPDSEGTRQIEFFENVFFFYELFTQFKAQEPHGGLLKDATEGMRSEDYEDI